MRIDMRFKLKNLIGDDFLQAFLYVPENVTSVDISYNELWKRTDAELATAFASLKDSVTSVDISRNRLWKRTGAELATAFAGFPNSVTSVKIRGNGLGKRTAAELATAFAGFSESVTSVDISYNHFGEKTGAELATAFAGFPNSVTSVNISSHNLGTEKTGAELATAFAGFTESVTSVIIRANGLGYKTGDELATAFAGFTESVTSVDISHNDLEKRTGAELATAFAGFKDSVTSVNIRANHLGYKTCDELATAFAGFKDSVTSVDISYNHFGEKTGAELATAFAGFNDSVTSVEICGNELGKKTGAELATAFAGFNDSVTSVDISNNGFEKKTIEELIEIFTSIPPTVIKLIVSDKATILHGRSDADRKLLNKVFTRDENKTIHNNNNNNNNDNNNKVRTVGTLERIAHRITSANQTFISSTKHSQGTPKKTSSSSSHANRDAPLIFDLGNDIELYPIQIMLKKYIAEHHPLHGEDTVCYMPFADLKAYNNGQANENVTYAVNTIKSLKPKQMNLIIIHIKKPGKDDPSRETSHFTLLAIRRASTRSLLAVYADSNGDFNKSAKHVKDFCGTNNIAWSCLDAKAVDPSKHEDLPGYQFMNDCGLHVYENAKILLDAKDEEFNPEYLTDQIREIRLHDHKVATTHRLGFAELVAKDPGIRVAIPDVVITETLRLAANTDDYIPFQQHIFSDLIQDIESLARTSGKSSGTGISTSQYRDSSDSHTHVQRRLLANASTNALPAQELLDILNSLQSSLNKVVEQTRSLNDCRAYMNAQIRRLQNDLDKQTLLTDELKPKHQLKALLQSLLEDDEDSEIVLIYFMTLKKHLTDCFIAARVVSSGIVERAPYLVADKVKKLFSSLGNLLLGVGDFVGLSTNELGKLIGEGLRSGGAALHITEFVSEALPESLQEFVSELLTSEETRLHKVASVSSGENYTMTGLEFTVDAIALILTYMYRPQIKCLTPEGAKRLAICGAERVMLIGKEGMIADSGDWIAKVILLIGHPALKQTRNFRHIQVTTHPQYKGRWTENGVYCKSGIMCIHNDEYMFFKGDKSKHQKYGFRISGKSIAEDCYGMQRMHNNGVSPKIKAAAKRYLPISADNKLTDVKELDPETVERLRALEKNEKSLSQEEKMTRMEQQMAQMQSMLLNQQQTILDLQSEREGSPQDNPERIIEQEDKQLTSEVTLLKQSVKMLNKKLENPSSIPDLKDLLVEISSQMNSVKYKLENHETTLRRAFGDTDHQASGNAQSLLFVNDFSEGKKRYKYFRNKQTELVERVSTLEIALTVMSEKLDKLTEQQSDFGARGQTKKSSRGLSKFGLK